MAKKTGPKPAQWRIDRRRQAFLEDFIPRTLKGMRYRATSKGMSWDVTAEDLADLFERQHFCCAVSGIAFNIGEAYRDNVRSPFRPSIDRIDSTGGYTRDNIRIVCEIVNFAMNKWGEAPLVELARAMANRHG